MRFWLVFVVLATPIGASADNSFLDDHPTMCFPFLEVKDPGVLRVKSRGPDESLFCSGVAISPTRVLTAKHCLRLGDDITVNGVEVKSWFLSETQDLALLIVNDPLPKWHPVTTGIPLALMLEGYGCSSDMLLQRSAILSHMHEHEIGISGCVCHGDSGGAVLDDAGRLIAIIVDTFEDGERGHGELPQPFLDDLSY